MTSRRLILGLVVAAALIAPGTGSALAAHPAGHDTLWAWITVRQPVTETYAPAAKDRGNSLGQGNAVEYFGSGQYLVILGGVGEPGGVVHVSTLGSPKVCAINQWTADSGDELVGVDCFTAAGTPHPAKFTVTYLNTLNDPGPMAYLYADQPSEQDYTPSAQFSFNSTGGTNTIHSDTVGHYVVTMPGLEGGYGNVQVSAALTINTRGPAPAGVVVPVVCNISTWYPSGSDLKAEVLCYDLTGAHVDTSFELSYTRGEGLKGAGGSNVAYAWANKQHAASDNLHGHFAYASPPGHLGVTRQGLGRYTVTASTMPKGGAVKVTAYGLDVTRCNVGSIRITGSPQQIGVKCFDFAGNPTDSRFTLSYLK